MTQMKALDGRSAIIGTAVEGKKNKVTTEQLKKQIAYQREKDREMVRGIFRFYEVPGGLLEFTYGPIYKGDQMENYSLRDGQIYTLPLGVAKHLNKNVWYPIHGYMMDENERPIMKINERVRRCGFQSLEFVDIDDLQSPTGDIVTVERVNL